MVQAEQIASDEKRLGFSFRSFEGYHPLKVYFRLTLYSKQGASMQLSQAIDYFAKDYLEGWNGSEWVPNIVYGSLLTYDRFISRSSFGLKKRIFLVGRDTGTLDDYGVVRFNNGTIYIVESKNADTDICPSNYNNSYQFLKAEYVAEVLELTQQVAASGTNRDTQREVIATHYADVERFSSKSSSEAPDVMYSKGKIVLPGSAVVTTDNEIRVGTVEYSIKEVDRLLLAVHCYVQKRSGDNV